MRPGFFSGAVLSDLAMGRRGLLPCRGRSIVSDRGALLATRQSLLVEPPGAERRADQRTRHHTGETDLLGLRGHLDELLGADPALDGVVPRRGAEVLRDRHQIAAGLLQVAERPGDLLAGLAHAEDEVRLGHQAEVT